MKLRSQTKYNHDGERIRLKEQTFFARFNISSLRVGTTYTRLKSNIFNLTAVVSQKTDAPRVNGFFSFFCKETFAGVKKKTLYQKFKATE